MLNIIRKCGLLAGSIALVTTFSTTFAHAATNETFSLTPPEFDYKAICIPKEGLIKLDKDWTNWNGKNPKVASKKLYQIATHYSLGSKKVTPNPELAFKMFSYLSKQPTKIKTKAKYQLARMYLKGRGVTQDSDIAKKMLEEVLPLFPLGAGMELAHIYIDENKYAEAEKLLKKAANAGKVEATWLLASLYNKGKVNPPSDNAAETMMKLAQNQLLEELGKGNCVSLYLIGRTYLVEGTLPRDEALSAAWLEKAVKIDELTAMLMLAEIYRKGVGVKHNMPRSVELWKTASEMGSDYAMYNLGQAYLLGTGVEIDNEQALIWLEKAVARGNKKASELIVDVYQGEYSLAANKELALKWMENAITNPNASVDVIYDLAKSYTEGEAGTKNHDKAFELYEKAAQSGNIDAIYELAMSHRRGRGTDPSPKKAMKFFRLAASRGSKDGMLAMSENYRCGIGTKEDPEKAKQWLEKALLAESAKALMNLADIYQAEGTPELLEKRLTLLRKAIRTDDRKAMVKMGESYILGLGVEKNKEEADKWFARAVAAGDNQVAGQLALAQAYSKSAALEPDDAKAMELFEAAMSSGKANAFYETAKHLINRSGNVPRDLPRIQKLFEKSASMDHSGATLALADFYLDGNKSQEHISQQKGQEWLHKAADAGEFKAMIKLSYLYQFGTANQAPDTTKAKFWMERAIASGPCQISDRLTVAQAYELGVGVPLDREIAKQWQEKAINSEVRTPVDMVKMAESQLNGYGTEPDAEAALKWYEKAAKAGNIQAMRAMGRIYHRGSMKGRNNELAMEWFNKAAKLGDMSSLNELGRIYAHGVGIPRDTAKAIASYEKAAHQGSIRAMHELGRIYSDRSNPVFSEDNASKWLDKAANKGSVSAIFSLVTLIVTPPDQTQPSPERISELINMAIESENKKPTDMYSISEAYAQGIGIPQDMNKAMEWLQKAANAGDAPSMRHLAKHYMDGKLLPRDVATAIKWYKKAASLGNYPAMVELGRAYSRGNGVDKNQTESFRYFNQAAEGGHTSAMREVGYLYIYGTGVSIDQKRGMEWFRQAAESGDDKSMMELANGYMAGVGVEQSRSLAIEWLKRAANSGSEKAQKQLLRLGTGGNIKTAAPNVNDQ